MCLREHLTGLSALCHINNLRANKSTFVEQVTVIATKAIDRVNKYVYISDDSKKMYVTQDSHGFQSVVRKRKYYDSLFLV